MAEKKKSIFTEFKEFISKGNVLDMAVGVIIGGAFTGIVTSLTSNFINPLLSLIMTGGPGVDENGVAWTIGAAASSFLTTVINFLITAFVLFCLIRSINRLLTIGKKKEAPAPTTKKCPYCLSEIPLEATRCPHCTSELKK